MARWGRYGHQVRKSQLCQQYGCMHEARSLRCGPTATRRGGIELALAVWRLLADDDNSSLRLRIGHRSGNVQVAVSRHCCAESARTLPSWTVRTVTAMSGRPGCEWDGEMLCVICCTPLHHVPDLNMPSEPSCQEPGSRAESETRRSAFSTTSVERVFET